MRQTHQRSSPTFRSPRQACSTKDLVGADVIRSNVASEAVLGGGAYGPRLSNTKPRDSVNPPVLLCGPPTISSHPESSSFNRFFSSRSLGLLAPPSSQLFHLSNRHGVLGLQHLDT